MKLAEALQERADLQKEADRIAKEIRQLDNLLQETNWTKELVE